TLDEKVALIRSDVRRGVGLWISARKRTIRHANHRATLPSRKAIGTQPEVARLAVDEPGVSVEPAQGIAQRAELVRIVGVIADAVAPDVFRAHPEAVGQRHAVQTQWKAI